MDNSIRIRWSGGERTCSPGAAVRFGRDPVCEVAFANTNVSRRHAELEYTSSGWVLRDVGSAQGTWLNGARTSSMPISGSCSVSLGQPPKGEVVEFVVAGTDGTRIGGDVPATELAGSTSRPPQAPTTGEPPTGGAIESAGTVIVGGSPDRPGGRLREGAVAGATVVTGDVLNLECGGASYSFQPGQTATIGRDESCDVVSTNPTVSRRHARVRHDGTGWLLEDSGSSSGTFVDGSRVTQLRLAGSTAAWLGSEETGERIVVVTSGTNKTSGAKRGRAGGRSRGLNLVVAAIAVLALLAAGVAVYLSTSAGPDNDELAQGTVLIKTTHTISAIGATVTGTGSGTVIDAERGLILTNAHVANPDVTGLDPVLFEGEPLPNPDEILLFITPGLDKPAEPQYRGEVVAVDGFLDLAVVKVTKTISGRFLRRGEFDLLKEVSLGDSDDVKSGDTISVFGFPTAAQSATATITTGVISGPVGSDILESNRAFLNVSAQISPGNSGGLAANEDGDIIGVPTIVRDDKIGSIRPINFAKPLIEAARSGKEYKTPYHE